MLPWWLSGKESACDGGDMGSISRSGRYSLEKEMAAHSSILAWKIPWTKGYSQWHHKSWTQLSY